MLKRWIARIIATVETGVDWVKEKLSVSLKIDDPLKIQPYIGYGTSKKFTLKGRVLENEGNRLPAADDPIWRNIIATYRYLESDEVPNAVVEATCVGITQTAVTDEEGYFSFTFEPNEPLTADIHRLPVQLVILDAPRKMPTPVTVVGEIVIAEKTAEFGIISDIDDTVLQSSAVNVIEAIKWMFLYNAKTRLPFDGVAAFYQALTRGKNPIFYVSSSPWNLYPMLIDFLNNQNIPIGPLFLKDYGITKDQLFTSGHSTHKLTQIKTILETYPNLSFILIGDSGQKDPEIYQEAVVLYPNRILAIYIRDVSKEKRDEEVEKIAADVQKNGVEMILAADSFAAADHAATHGWVPSNWKMTS